MRLEQTFHGQTINHSVTVAPGGRRVISIGRADGTLRPDIDLAPDFTTSRCHAEIEIDSSGRCWVRDLESSHGTKLNGKEIKGIGRQPLHSGDTLLLGETALRIDPTSERDDAFRAGVRIGGEIDANAGVPALLRPATQSISLGDIQAKRLLEIICDLPLQFASQPHLPSLLQLIVQRMVEVIPGASRGALVLLRSSWNTPQKKEGSGRDTDHSLVPHAFYPLDGPPVLSRTLAWRAINEGHGFVWSREAEQKPISGSIEYHGIESGMYAPLLWQGRPLGALCVDNGGEIALSAFSPDDLRLMLMVAQYAAMAVANQILQEDLRGAWTGALEALTAALAARDTDTQGHCYRTVELAVILARRMGLPDDQLPSIARGALLHDIGKIGIPDNILFKPGALSPEERETMKGHPELGHRMLQHIPFFQDALSVVLHHHEQFNGNGYPSGLHELQIPHGARIFHVVDIYDALTQERPYKAAWSHEDAIAEIARLAGTECDPEAVSALQSLEPEITDRIRGLKEFSPGVRELLGQQSGTPSNPGSL
jgi:putative nucleotidyltransferase with HDIG domain